MKNNSLNDPFKNLSILHRLHLNFSGNLDIPKRPISFSLLYPHFILVFFTMLMYTIIPIFNLIQALIIMALLIYFSYISFVYEYLPQTIILQEGFLKRKPFLPFRYEFIKWDEINNFEVKKFYRDWGAESKPSEIYCLFLYIKYRGVKKIALGGRDPKLIKFYLKMVFGLKELPKKG